MPGDGAHEGFTFTGNQYVAPVCAGSGPWGPLYRIPALLPKTPILVPIIINTLIAFIMGGQVMAASSDILRAVSHLSCSASVNFLQKHKR